MRRFLIVGQTARASPDFLLVDIPSTSGRVDVLLRALRAALLCSHSVRRDTIVYLVLLGLPECPRTVRIEGSASRYLRPDERSLGATLKKVLAWPTRGASFVEARPGMAIAAGGIETVLPEIIDSTLYLLETDAPDIRSQSLLSHDTTFVLGDHTGLTAALRQRILDLGASTLSLGPRALHTEDAIAVVHNELDRAEVSAT